MSGYRAVVSVPLQPGLDAEAAQDTVDWFVRMVQSLSAEYADAAGELVRVPVEVDPLPDWREHVAGWMNLYPEVRWDRMTHSDAGEVETYSWPEQVWAFGWVDRDDGRADFVTLVFFRSVGDEWDAPYVATSSARYSAEFAERASRSSTHHDCERVEDLLGDLVHRKVELQP